MPRSREEDEDEVAKKASEEEGAEEKEEGAGAGAGEDEESEEEYEIEAVLDHKPDVFGKGKEGFLVKWKDYPDSENSWVKPEDAGNAKQLLEEFVAKRRAKQSGSSAPKKRGRPSRASEPSPSPPPAQSSRRKSTTNTSAVSTSTFTKKQNKNKVETDEEDENEGEDAEMEDARPSANNKRPRKSNGTSTSAAAPGKKRRKTQQQEDEGGEDEDETITPVRPSTLAKFKDRSSWESVIVSIDTVERADDKRLQVFFRMKGVDLPCVEENDVCKQKFPQKLLEFYERNLRWKAADDNAAEEE